MNTTITIKPTITITRDGDKHRVIYTIKQPWYYSFSTIADTATEAVECMHRHLRIRGLLT